MRHSPVTPLGLLLLVEVKNACVDMLSGLMHATTEDDYYNGYFIPKGS